MKDGWLDNICQNPGLNQGPLNLLSNAQPTELFQLLIHHCPVHQTSGSFKTKTRREQDVQTFGPVDIVGSAMKAASVSNR